MRAFSSDLFCFTSFLLTVTSVDLVGSECTYFYLFNFKSGTMDLKFELGSLYQLEKSIKGFLLSTLNVRELSDIRRNALKAANKDIAVDLAMTLASMLDRSVELLRSASADLDCMKREQLASIAA